jgi:hypothetical protein
MNDDVLSVDENAFIGQLHLSRSIWVPVHFGELDDRFAARTDTQIVLDVVLGHQIAHLVVHVILKDTQKELDDLLTGVHLCWTVRWLIF